MVLGAGPTQVTSLTDAMRSGERSFELVVPGGDVTTPPPGGGGGGSGSPTTTISAPTPSVSAPPAVNPLGSAGTTTASLSSAGGDVFTSFIAGLVTTSLFGVVAEDDGATEPVSFTGQISGALIGYAAAQLTIAAGDFAQLVAEIAQAGTNWLQSQLQVAGALPAETVPWARIMAATSGLGTAAAMMPAGSVAMAAALMNLHLPGGNRAAPTDAVVPPLPAPPATPQERREQQEARDMDALPRQLAPAADCHAPSAVDALAAAALFAGGFLWKEPPSSRRRSAAGLRKMAAPTI
jgi:hypothetical protein